MSSCLCKGHVSINKVEPTSSTNLGTTQSWIVSRFRIACFYLKSWVQSNQFLKKILKSSVEMIRFPGKPLESWVDLFKTLASWVDSTQIKLSRSYLILPSPNFNAIPSDRYVRRMHVINWHCAVSVSVSTLSFTTTRAAVGYGGPSTSLWTCSQRKSSSMNWASMQSANSGKSTSSAAIC